MNIPPNDRAVDETEAASILGLSPATLRKMRCLGPQEKGLPEIPYVKYSSRCVRYIVSDLEAWRNSHRVQGGAA